MSEIEFSIIGSGKIPSPFNQQKTIEKSNFVFHLSKSEIINDQKCHIYVEEIRSLTKNITIYANTEQNLSDYPKKLYVIYGSNLEENNDLEEFLYENMYLEEDDIREERKIDCPFQDFVKKSKYLKTGTLQNYISMLFNSIGIEDEALDYVNRYISNFYVAVTSSDTKISNAENYELLESFGDHASWKPMTEIFLKYMKENNLEMKESIITSMHRSFVSKVIQAKICRSINLHQFIVTKKQITTSVCEDVFEAFTGALFYTDHLIQAYTGKYFEMGEKFLKWCFSSVDFSVFEEKPEITQFHEYMKILIGPFNFSERKHGGLSFMNPKKDTKEKLQKALSHVSEKTIDEFLLDVKKPYHTETDNSNEERRVKYLKINKFIEENFGNETFFINLKNETFLKDWKDESRNNFLNISQKYGGLIIDRRYSDKSKANFYWLLQTKDKKDVFSTMNYSDSENPDTLISLMIENVTTMQKLDTSKLESRKYTGKGNYYLENGEKYTIEGDKYNIEEFLKEKLLDKRNKYYLSVINEISEEIYIEYSPYHEITFDSDFDIRYIRSILSIHNATEYPKAIYKYIGDRMSYGQLSLIAIKKFRIRDDHTMSTIKNFFRSKNLKDEFTRMINIKNQDGELIHYDELLGMNYQKAHLVIEYIYTKMIFSNEIIQTPNETLTKLMRAICKTKNKTEEKINISSDRYTYCDTTKKKFSVKIEGHNYNQVKNCFSKFLISREKKNNPDWNDSLNHQFSMLPNYQDLESVLKQKSICEWEITSGKNEKNLSITFEFDSKLFTFKSNDSNGFSVIVRQITESLGI